MSNICISCIGDSFLKETVQKHFITKECSYCKKQTDVVTLQELGRQIEFAIRQHYRQVTFWSMFDNIAEEQDVISVIQNNANIPFAAAKDIQELLQGVNGDKLLNRIFNPGKVQFRADRRVYLQKITDDIWQNKWSEFEESLKNETRYFSSSGLELLRSIFDKIEDLQTFIDIPIVQTIGPGTEFDTLYRARAFQSREKLAEALKYPDIHLSAPPQYAAVGGRMNAKGISVFYGTNDEHTAMAEVRPPVGSQVVTASFAIIRKLRVINLVALKSLHLKGSIFDKNFVDNKKKTSFLFKLSQRMTQPVMPDDEALEYLVTQAIADFLSSESNLNLDGIIFPSSQVSGDVVNLVLFHKAALTEEVKINNIKKVEVQLKNPSDVDKSSIYQIIEHIDNNIPTDQIEVLNSKSLSPTTKRTPTLKLDVESLKVHIIKAIQYSTEELKVERIQKEIINQKPPLKSERPNLT